MRNHNTFVFVFMESKRSISIFIFAKKTKQKKKTKKKQQKNVGSYGLLIFFFIIDPRKLRLILYPDKYLFKENVFCYFLSVESLIRPLYCSLNISSRCNFLVERQDYDQIT